MLFIKMSNLGFVRWWITDNVEDRRKISVAIPLSGSGQGEQYQNSHEQVQDVIIHLCPEQHTECKPDIYQYILHMSVYPNITQSLTKQKQCHVNTFLWFDFCFFYPSVQLPDNHTQCSGAYGIISWKSSQFRITTTLLHRAYRRITFKTEILDSHESDQKEFVMMLGIEVRKHSVLPYVSKNKLH